MNKIIIPTRQQHDQTPTDINNIKLPKPGNEFIMKFLIKISTPKETKKHIKNL